MTRTIFFTETSQSLGGQELQALEQMEALKAIHYQVILFCKLESEIAKAAKLLGITEVELKAAFGDTMPLDFAAAAKKLGMTEAALKAKLGVK